MTLSSFENNECLTEISLNVDTSFDNISRVVLLQFGKLKIDFFLK